MTDEERIGEMRMELEKLERKSWLFLKAVVGHIYRYVNSLIPYPF